MMELHEKDVTGAKLDAKFAILKAIPDSQNVCVVFYYSGHGVMDETDTGTSCVVLPDRKESKLEYYPIERALLGLARRPNFYVLAAFEACRESTINMESFIRYNPSFIADLEQVANEGSWTVLHSCEEGDTTIDTPGEDPYTKKKIKHEC